MRDAGPLEGKESAWQTRIIQGTRSRRERSGGRKIKASLVCRDIVLSKRRIARIMKDKDLVSRPHTGKTARNRKRAATSWLGMARRPRRWDTDGRRQHRPLFQMRRRR